MHRLQLHYTLSQDSSPASVRNPLIDLLQAVAEHGSISAASRALALSYRHVWGELKRWEVSLGQELLVWEKGQSARLSEFGNKLMWAEKQAQARLAPQIEALRGDLEHAFSVAFNPHAHVVTLYASHDEGLSRLREYALNQVAPLLHLDIRFCGSVDAIRALNEGRCVLAGFHTQALPGEHALAQKAFKPLLKPGLHKIIGFAQRSQGLLVAKGNPLGIQGLRDVATHGYQFINRAHGTGTRLLVDERLASENLKPEDIKGYDQTEPSHTALAHAVAAHKADAGMGIEAAAHALGLGFVPLVLENYYLVCLKSALDEAPIAALRALLQSAQWQTHLHSLSGYTPVQSGAVLSLKTALPWWRFNRPPAAYTNQNVS